MAIEDAACLGIVFSPKYYRGNVEQALQLYETVRKPRATKVQAAAARARENIHERIGTSGGPQADDRSLVLTFRIVGFSDKTDSKHYGVKDEKGKLTIAEMNRYV